MKILLTGATGYIGKRLIPLLLNDGHQVVCCVRDKNRFSTSQFNSENVSVVEVDFLNVKTLKNIPEDIEVAYYLIHSMSASEDDFERLEAITATNFKNYIELLAIKQVIYLSGIVNEEELSQHLSSRKNVEAILTSGSFNLTTLRAGIIVGSGSGSFEIIRDLVEKLPFMITPKWLHTKSQPIAIRNVLQFLIGVLGYEYTFNKSFDIGSKEILTYKQMLLQFAEVRKLKRTIICLPIMTPKLSSYWLYFVTSTSYKLASHLVDSMKIEVICTKNDLAERLNIKLLTYKEAVELAFHKIDEQNVESSWTDAQSSKKLLKGVSKLIEVPSYGCFKDSRIAKVKDEATTIYKIWSIGGETGWYYGNILWSIRGFMDKLVGGAGLKRGRKNMTDIHVGDSLDFWRVLDANKKTKRLLLYAEMKLPGEAWLEFKIINNELHQTATFRPLGVMGRLYWYSVLPFHAFIFNGMIKKLTN
ncbi:SDR family oxidoreductase [Lutibacter sp.]|uniref:SDR family oxidoreductase n=1 Tax=Lutibacter sp. TaxID=1925666 RepID=UPI001A22F8F2|nr:SDR family oxidoreductase [Lutibacter sp.]MBI9042767.1 SDR family oxidoreductase [Lutibacter sp.]